MTLDEPDHRALAGWAADCAARVLPTFERHRPQDYRTRDAVEAARAWAQGKITVSEARAAAFAAHAAARDAGHPAARSAAHAAGHAAATAHVADHARHAATYAAACVQGDAAVREREQQYQELPEHLRSVVYPAPVRR
ncbi:putative immunity protein [Haloechinothrix salitolerans]|uniref:Immunity protein n=1 Tax=Haloechinothrix salitolerans TaxID=926830 RepID=A0ABW2BW37_9PSEU